MQKAPNAAKRHGLPMTVPREAQGQLRRFSPDHAELRRFWRSDHRRGRDLRVAVFRHILRFKEGMIAAFFDDSGTHSTSPVIAIGGLLGTEEQWDAFAPAWTEQLNEPLPGKPKLSQFHLSPCRAGKGEFRDYSRTESDFLTAAFRRIILDIGLVTVAAAVNRVAWNELVVGDVAKELGSPEELCFYKCVESVINVTRLRKPGEKVMMVFDEGTRDKLQWWTDLFNEQQQIFPELDRVFFAPVSKVVALQGADMIATETYQFAQAWIKDGEDALANPHFAAFRYRDLSTGLIFDRDQISEIVMRVRGKLARQSAPPV